jgi:HTH-type transcriptional regulator/antitoxin HigA
MQALPYTVIKTALQYQQYCARLEELATAADAATRQDELDLLTLLIETWDRTHATLPEADPIELLRSLMASQGLAAKDLAALLEVGKSTVSDILNRRRGLSKEVIRRLASHFQVAQEAFNRPYELVVTVPPLPRATHLVCKGTSIAA